MSKECEHVLIARGDEYVCIKCGDTFQASDFDDRLIEFPECQGGRCGIV